MVSRREMPVPPLTTTTCAARDELVDRRADLVGLVAHDAIARHDRSRGLGVLAQPEAVRVVVGGAGVADRDDADRDRASLGGGGAVRVGAHDERS